MKAAEIITDAMVEKALDAFFEVEGWRRDKPKEEALLRQDIRRALAAVAPLFAEKFAKIADAEAKRASDLSTQMGLDGRKDAMYQANNAYHAAFNIAAAIRATKGAARG